MGLSISGNYYLDPDGSAKGLNRFGPTDNLLFHSIHSKRNAYIILLAPVSVSEKNLTVSLFPFSSDTSCGDFVLKQEKCDPKNFRLKCDHTISGALFCAKGIV